MRFSLKNAYFIFSIISLISGTVVYPLFRGPNLLVWSLFPKPEFWDEFRIPLKDKGFLLSLFVDSGPDCLWFLSGVLALRGVWLFEQKTMAIYTAFFYIVAASYNAGQYFGIIPGTFDIFDLLTMSGVALIEGIIFNLLIKRRIQYEKENV